MLPSAAASFWTSHYGIRAARGLLTRPFPALRLLHTDIWPHVMKCPIMFLISTEKPIGPATDLFITLTEGSPCTPREFQVTPWLDTESSSLYLHTAPFFLDKPAEDDAVGDEWDSNFHFSPSDKERFFRILDSDYDKLWGYFKHNAANTRRSGGEEPVEIDWDTWSAYSKVEIEQREGFQVFEQVILERLDTHDKSNILHELACFKQLSWLGVTKVVEWIEAAKTTSSGNRLRLSSNQTDENSSLNLLQRIPIPYDSKAREEFPDDSDSDDDLDLMEQWSPPIPRFDLVISRPSIPAAEVKVLAFDLFGTVLDRETAIWKAIELLLTSSPAELNPKDLQGAERRELLELFVETETIYTHEDPDARYETVLQHVLRTIADHVGAVDLPNETLRQAADLAISPTPFPEALRTLESLMQQGYTIILLSPVDEHVLSRVFAKEVQLDAELSQWIIHTPLSYSPLPDQALNALTELASSIHPGILPFQIVAVTICVAGAVEPCASHGIPSVLLRRQTALKSGLNLDSSAPTLEIADLSELSVRLQELATKPVTQSKDPEPSADGTRVPVLNDLNQLHRISKLYQSTEVLGSGSFGTVEGATHIYSGASVAVKWELHYRDVPYALPYERAVYRVLGDQPWLPRIHWSGEDGGAPFMVMDRVGITLGQLLRGCRGKFSLKTVLMLGIRMIGYLEYIHSKGVVSKDVAWSNFAMGIGENSNTLYMIDFGLAKLYRDPKTGEHIPYRDGLLNPGAPRFISHNTHRGVEPTRRDDMEALAYILLNFYHGRLPWQGIYAPDVDAKKKRIGEMKAPGGKALTKFLAASEPEFSKYIEHVQGLSFSEEPGYSFLKGLFEQRMEREGWENDEKYDWLLDGKTLVPADYRFDDTVFPNEEIAYHMLYY